jgi:DNA-directed RNA polymerases I, II, and III subunit RPABC1
VFCPPEPVKIAVIREIYSGVKEDNLSRLILILQSRVMSRAKESIKEIFPFKVDTFQVRFCLMLLVALHISFSFCK